MPRLLRSWKGWAVLSAAFLVCAIAGTAVGLTYGWPVSSVVPWWAGTALSAGVAAYRYRV